MLGVGVEERGDPGILSLRDNEVFGESSCLLLSDTGGKELTFCNYNGGKLRTRMTPEVI